jgi:hypothetical protein
LFEIFTSLRDGNRPHRIVGLTQQGHDSGAERKVDKELNQSGQSKKKN